MAFTKITSEDLADKGVVGLADTPNLSVTALQKKFDEIATDVIVPKFNNLVDELDTFETDVDITERVKSDEITNIRTDEDDNLQISRDNGTTWSATASSGHVIEDGNGTAYPSRGRMQFSSNVNIMDVPADNTTFVQVASGEKGEPGEDATIAVGNVTSSGTSVSVTNVGSPSNAIFDFVLPKGDDGSAATIQVGTVTSGQNASVSNRGTSSSAIFDFVLPKGDKGDAGTSFKVLGMYATYSDLIAAHPTGQKGDAYAVGDSTLNVIYNWNNDTRTWDNLGSLQGAKGDTGDAATVTIGTVSTLNPTDSAYVTNDGTTSNAVFSFGIPKGDKGDQGTAATIAIGTVSKGENPSVTNVGTTTNAIFDMVLPKGDKGDPTTVNGKSGETIQLNGADISLTGYRDNVTGSIAPTDTINQAISKLANNSGGAKIIVTADSESIGNTMTCSNGAQTYSSTVGTDEKVIFTVNDVGTWTITNTTTEREASVNVPYFGVYNVALGYGDVIINVIYDVEYVGATFTISYDGHTRTKVADGTLEMTFVMADYTTYSITNTYDERVKTLTVTEGGEYEVAFVVSSFGYQGWLDSASITTSFSSLDGVLADEKTVRILMTKHSSVDYMLGWLEADNTLSTTLLSSDNALKWIGLRDYAYDSMPSTFITSWLNGTKWEYALKDKVPTMTSNSAPYGSTSASAVQSGSYAYYAFDNSDSNTWWGGTGVRTAQIQYHFTNPICVKKVYWKDSGSLRTGTYKIEGSNDGSTWISLTDTLTATQIENTININNDNYYIYYRFNHVNSASNIGMCRLQFYGRSLSVSVPTMTSNTTPYGQAIGSTPYSDTYTYFKAFDGTTTNFATANSSANEYIGYKFTIPVMIKRVDLTNHKNSSGASAGFVNAKIQGSNDNFATIEYEKAITNSTVAEAKTTFDISDNAKQCSYWRIITNGTPSTNINVRELQFYGLDYSEHAERHYIYDNGVEVETVTPYVSNATITKNSNNILLSKSDNKVTTIQSPKINLTSYSLMRSVLGNIVATNGGMLAMATQSGSATCVTTLNNLPYNFNLDISNVNEEMYCIVGYNSTTNYTASMEVKEWWIE